MQNVCCRKKHNTRLDLTAIVFSEYAFLSLHLLLLLSAKKKILRVSSGDLFLFLSLSVCGGSELSLGKYMLRSHFVLALTSVSSMFFSRAVFNKQDIRKNVNAGITYVLYTNIHIYVKVFTECYTFSSHVNKRNYTRVHLTRKNFKIYSHAVPNSHRAPKTSKSYLKYGPLNTKQLSHSDISLCSSHVSSYLYMPSTIVFIMFGTERIVGVTQGKVIRSTCSEVFVRNTKSLLNMFTMSSTRVQKCAGKCGVPSFCRLLQQLQLLEEVKPPVQILLAIYGQSKRWNITENYMSLFYLAKRLMIMILQPHGYIHDPKGGGGEINFTSRAIADPGFLEAGGGGANPEGIRQSNIRQLLCQSHENKKISTERGARPQHSLVSANVELRYFNLIHDRWIPEEWIFQQFEVHVVIVELLNNRKKEILRYIRVFVSTHPQTC